MLVYKVLAAEIVRNSNKQTKTNYGSEQLTLSGDGRKSGAFRSTQQLQCKEWARIGNRVILKVKANT